jgi:tRNA threonylcarbamoyladenosine biosynthesis protein TsaE
MYVPFEFVNFALMKLQQVHIIISKSEKETISAGMDFAESLKPGDVIGLKGNLGSGNTQFVKGVSQYFNVKDVVNSPTFLIVNQYTGTDPVSGKNITVNHFDLYRLRFKEELETIGFEDYINDKSVCLIEWCELAEEFLGTGFQEVNFDFGSKDTERILKFIKK